MILIEFVSYRNGGWIRVFGKGFSWKPKSEGLTFSQRNGYTNYLSIFGFVFTVLKK